MKHRLLILLLVCGAWSTGNQAQAQIAEPSQYGRVVLNRYSSKASVGPVVFDHWLHRAIFTCRLCHVDVGFAMQANATDVKASTNREGFHCGACHDGKKAFTGKPVFPACSDAASGGNQQCARCHSLNQEGARKYDFDTFTANFPKDLYGVNWEQTEASGLIKPIDFLEGVSIKRPPLKNQEDFSIKTRGTWVSDIIFSHKKHSALNGCEVCHPEIFPSTKKGAIKYSMTQISAGQYCGVCHGRVAFPVNACERCHAIIFMPGPPKAAGFGAVRFMHKSHGGERNARCEACHHPSKPEKPEKAAAHQPCSDCHTETVQSPLKTKLQAAFHNPTATAGICVDCHKAENARNFNRDADFVRSLLPHHQAAVELAKTQLAEGKDAQMRRLAQEIISERQAQIDQMQLWLKQHPLPSLAPIKCRDCHKKENNSR